MVGLNKADFPWFPRSVSGWAAPRPDRGAAPIDVEDIQVTTLPPPAMVLNRPLDKGLGRFFFNEFGLSEFVSPRPKQVGPPYCIYKNQHGRMPISFSLVLEQVLGRMLHLCIVKVMEFPFVSPPATIFFDTRCRNARTGPAGLPFLSPPVNSRKARS